jgi:hypothetical protein
MVLLGKISVGVFTDFGVDFVCAITELEKSIVRPTKHTRIIGKRLIAFLKKLIILQR